MTDTVKDAVGNIAAMEYAGELKAIFCVMVDKDGDLRLETCVPTHLNHHINSALSLMQLDFQRYILETSKKQKNTDV